MSLIEELQYWCSDQDKAVTGSKALMTYNKCLMNNKTLIAERIADKHGKYFPKSDLEMAFGMLLTAAKK